MLIVSARKDFTDADRLLDEGHIIRDVNLSNDQTTEVSTGEVIKKTRRKTICIFVHGYNNEFFEVNESYQIMESNIRNTPGIAYDEIIGYHWPGGDCALKWEAAQRRSNAVEEGLGSFWKFSGTEAQQLT